MVIDYDFGEAMNAWATMHEEHVAQIAALKAERDRMREALESISGLPTCGATCAAIAKEALAATKDGAR